MAQPVASVGEAIMESRRIQADTKEVARLAHPLGFGDEAHHAEGQRKPTLDDGRRHSA